MEEVGRRENRMGKAEALKGMWCVRHSLTGMTGSEIWGGKEQQNSGELQKGPLQGDLLGHAKELQCFRLCVGN